MNRSQARSAIDFLDSELDKVSMQLNYSEEQLRDFMNQNQLVQLDAQAQQFNYYAICTRSRKPGYPGAVSGSQLGSGSLSG